MKGVLRLYPTHWCERYREELNDLVEEYERI